MTTAEKSPVVRYMRRLAATLIPAELSDGQLLERFANQGDETAFAALVWRHGPLVLGVCRRVLGDWHDAEDAFQATFVALSRQATSLRRPESLGPHPRSSVFLHHRGGRRHTDEPTAMVAFDAFRLLYSNWRDGW